MGSYNFKSSGKTVSKIRQEVQARTVIPVGIKTPLRQDEKNLFGMHYNVVDQVHDNLRNLLLTNWGERLGFYDFGANLRELTTEISSIDAFDEAAIGRIRDAVSRWMPFVNLKDFVSEIDNQNNLHTGIIRITITYSIPQLGIDSKALKISLYAI